jgi:prepilin-type N-terminal cleavage/methylation domain-containing protein
LDGSFLFSQYTHVKTLLPVFPPPSIPKRHVHGADAFTLIELLLVIAIIAIVAALLIPVISMMRERADSAACLSNLRQIGMGISAYMNDHETIPGPLSLTQGPTYSANTPGALALFLEPYLGTAGTNSPSAGNHFSPLFNCPTASRKLLDPTKPTYVVNMLIVPYYGQPVWGDITSGQKPLPRAALVNWTDAENSGIPLDLSAMWAIQDGDQDYVYNHTNFFTGNVGDLLPLPAHVTHYNAIFFDFHAAPREAGMQITEPGGGPSSSPAPSGTSSTGTNGAQ